jgi:hypothetical protein
MSRGKPPTSSAVTWSNPTLALGDVPAALKINEKKSGAGGKGFGKLRGMFFRDAQKGQNNLMFHCLVTIRS